MEEKADCGDSPSDTLNRHRWTSGSDRVSRLSVVCPSSARRLVERSQARAFADRSAGHLRLAELPEHRRLGRNRIEPAPHQIPADIRERG